MIKYINSQGRDLSSNFEDDVIRRDSHEPRINLYGHEHKKKTKKTLILPKINK